CAMSGHKKDLAQDRGLLARSRTPVEAEDRGLGRRHSFGQQHRAAAPIRTHSRFNLGYLRDSLAHDFRRREGGPSCSQRRGPSYSRPETQRQVREGVGAYYRLRLLQFAWSHHRNRYMVKFSTMRSRMLRWYV